MRLAPGHGKAANHPSMSQIVTTISIYKNRHRNLVKRIEQRACLQSNSDGVHSQATTEKDKGGQNAQAKRDHPEAPGPVIGMNDERGGVSMANVWTTKGSLTICVNQLGHKA